MQRVTVRRTERLLHRLDALAAERGRTRAALAREMLEQGVPGVLAPVSETPTEEELLGLLSEKARQGNVAAPRRVASAWPSARSLKGSWRGPVCPDRWRQRQPAQPGSLTTVPVRRRSARTGPVAQQPSGHGGATHADGLPHASCRVEQPVTRRAGLEVHASRATRGCHRGSDCQLVRRRAAR